MNEREEVKRSNGRKEPEWIEGKFEMIRWDLGRWSARIFERKRKSICVVKMKRRNLQKQGESKERFP
jgi:hypothetical protein